MTHAITVDIHTSDGDKTNVTKFTLEQATELERIVIIQNIFKIMGVDTALSDMVDDYVRIGQAFHEVGVSKAIPDPIESPSTGTLVLKKGTDYKVEQQTKPTQTASTPPTPNIPLKSTATPQQTMTPTPIDVPKTEENDALGGFKNSAMANALAKVMPALPVTPTATNTPTNAPTKTASEEPSHYETGIKKTTLGERYQCRLHCVQCGFKKTYYVKKNEVQVYCQNCRKNHSVRPAKKEGRMIPDAMHNYFIAGNFIGEDEAGRTPEQSE